MRCIDVPVATSWWRLSMVRDVQIDYQNVSISFKCKAVRFCRISGGSISVRYQLVRCYDVSKMSVPFRYQLRHFCDVLSWSVSLRYQLIRRYDVSDWLVLFTYQWDVAKLSQIGPSHWRIGCDVVMTSKHGLRRPNVYETQMRRCYDVACRLGYSCRF